MNDWKQTAFVFIAGPFAVLTGGYFVTQFTKMIAPHLTGEAGIAAPAAGSLGIIWLSIGRSAVYDALKGRLIGSPEHRRDD